MSNWNKPIFCFILIISLTSCISIDRRSYTYNTLPANPDNPTREVKEIALNGKVYSAVWQQNAGEFRALCYQAYNQARVKVDQALSMQYSKPLAIVTDIDETFLDNSPYAVTQAKIGNEFDPVSWHEWTSKGEAIAFPGSKDFFNYAASKGITIFYISNRDEQDKVGTVKNLKDLEFPFADNEHVVVKITTSDKEARRQKVAMNYEIVLLLGDNLNDFTGIFYKKSQSERNQITDDMAKEFGNKYIVLPNSGYGDWESALPGYKHSLSPAGKDSVYLNSVRGY